MRRLRGLGWRSKGGERSYHIKLDGTIESFLIRRTRKSNLTKAREFLISFLFDPLP